MQWEEEVDILCDFFSIKLCHYNLNIKVNMHEIIVVAFKGVEYDVKDWLCQHPGGPKVIRDYLRL